MQEVNVAQAVDRHNDWLADQMVEVFTEHSVFQVDAGTHALTEEGYDRLHTFFGNVYINYRADVFEKFLTKLNERGYRYSVENFTEESVH